MEDKIIQPKFDRALVWKTAAIGATSDELDHFLYLAEQYNLDPLKKEIYFLKRQGGSPTIITSRDGYLKCANSNDSFDGIESDVVYEGDRLTRREDGSIHIEYGINHLKFVEGTLSGAYANVFRKDRAKAATAFVSLADYAKENNVWKTYKNAMILKVAEAMALKRGFALSGLVTQEELGE